MNHEPYVSRLDRWWLEFNKCLLKKIEAYEDTVSIIIQGPLNKRSINTIPNYLKCGEVIVSCWNNDDLSLLDAYKDKIKIIVNNYKDIFGKAKRTNQKHPLILQNHTTYNGLKEATGYFAIKTRSDESYPSLDPLLKILKSNRDSQNWYKIVTSNIYFRRDSQVKFHPSDHLIAGNKKRMQEIFEYTYMRCIMNRIGALGPEQLIAHGVISTYLDPILKFRDKPDPNRSKEQMKKHFDIIRIRDLPNRTWTSSYRRYDSLRAEEDWCHHINDL